MYDTLIIGGGPAGVAAAVYAARKKLKTLLIAEEIGGQSSVSEGIENWIGTPKISGADLAQSFRAHIEAVKGDCVTLALGERIEAITKTEDSFVATTRSGKNVSARTVLIASGARRRKLTIPGAATFENKGVTYCASCDGPLFSGLDVAVIGGGNAGFETAAQLLAYAKSVTLLNRGKTFKADPTTVEKVCANEHMHALLNSEPIEITGEQFVTGLKYNDKNTDSLREMPVAGVFVEVGVLPNTSFVQSLVSLDDVGHIITDPRTQRTSVEGIWAAGDCTDELYHQNNIAAGRGVTAIEDLYLWLKRQ